MSALSQPKIPPELIRPILEYIRDKASLFSLALTCRAFQVDAERLLYNSVVQYTDISTHTMFLTSINNAQRLPPLVKEYAINSIIDREDANLWGLLQSALKKMINLKVLDFHESSGQPSADLILNAHFRLEKLYWGCHSDEEAMRVILAEQKDLKSLRFNCSEGTRPYDLDACPNLTSLWGNRSSIKALLPGRKVVSLSWVPDLDDAFNDPIVGLEKEFSRIKMMSFGGYFRRPSLNQIAHLLTSIEVLEIIGYDEEEESLIKTLGSMRELVLSRIWVGSEFSFTLEQREDMVKAYFSALPRLERISIAYGTAAYQSWVRGSSQIQIRTMFDVLSRFGSWI